jgi:hypothetical protein
MNPRQGIGVRRIGEGPGETLADEESDGQGSGGASGRSGFVRRTLRELPRQRGRGRKESADLRAPEVQNAAQGAIFWILTNGVVRTKMPVWSKLPEPERWQRVSYIQSLSGVKTESNTAEAKE